MKKVSKIIGIVLMCSMMISALSGIVFADTATNVALNAAVSSATHPNGGWDAAVKQLSNLTDGSSANYLRVHVNSTNGTVTSNPIHLCVDLGATYTVDKLVLKPRQGYNVEAARTVTIYGSNDSVVTSGLWSTAGDLTVLYETETLKQNTALEILLSNKSYRYIVVTMAGSSAYGAMTIGDLEAWADPSTATTVSVSKNMALALNNSRVNVSSVTHPNGGQDGANNLKPLSNLVDGSYDPNYLSLTYEVSNGTEYAPVGTGKTIQACVDLGEIYSIDKLVIVPRNANGSTLMEGFTVYGSNDPKIKTADWENADMYAIKTIDTADYTGTSNSGYGYLTITDDYEIDMSTLSEENSNFRYIVLAQPKTESNKYQYYYIKIGDLEIWADPSTKQDGALVTTSSKYPSPGASFDASISDSIGYTGLFNNRNAVAFIAAQYRNNRLEDIKYIDVTKADLATSKLSLTMPSDTKNVKYRYYIWSDLKNCEPLTPADIYTYGLTNVASGKTVDSVSFDKNENGKWSIDGNSAAANQFSSFGLCDGDPYKPANVFYVNNAVDTKNSIDAYVDLGEQYEIECIKMLPRGDGQGSTNLANMEVYGFNDIEWITKLEGEAKPRVTEALLSENATLLYKYPSDYAEYKHTANATITDEVTSTIDVGGQSFRYIMCVRPWDGYKYWAFGEMEVYSKNN